MTEEEKKLEQELIDIFNHNYSNTTFTSRLYDMFSKDDEAIMSYIKPDRLFWHYDIDREAFRKIRITYVRSGVMFYVYEDEPDGEEGAWFMQSFNAMSLYAAQIYPHEIGKLLSKHSWAAELDFPKKCKECKWGDCNGRITVEVVWDEPETK